MLNRGLKIMTQSLKILYEDADIIVCIKPPGTASETRRSGQQDMVSLIRNYRYQKGEEPYAGLIHRLDQPVEGILVFGKHAAASAALSRQLAQGNFSKIYLAVTEGNMPDNQGRLCDFLKKDSRSNTSRVVPESEPQAKKAELLYQVLKTDAEQIPVQNLVRIQLLTGRHHQIRVQMAHSRTPLFGDRKYGGFKDLQKNPKESGLGLCACELAFAHPVTDKALKFQIYPSQPVFQKFAKYFPAKDREISRSMNIF